MGCNPKLDPRIRSMRAPDVRLQISAGLEFRVEGLKFRILSGETGLKDAS